MKLIRGIAALQCSPANKHREFLEWGSEMTSLTSGGRILARTVLLTGAAAAVALSTGVSANAAGPQLSGMTGASLGEGVSWNAAPEGVSWNGVSWNAAPEGVSWNGGQSPS